MGDGRSCYFTGRAWRHFQSSELLWDRNVDPDSSPYRDQHSRRVRSTQFARHKVSNSARPVVPPPKGNWDSVLKLLLSPILSKSWRAVVRVHLLLLMVCFTCLLTTATAALPGVECPQRCLCANASTDVTTDPITNVHTRDSPSALGSINCSNLGLARFTVHLTAAVGYHVPKSEDGSEISGDEKGEDIVILTLDFLDQSHNMLTSVVPSIGEVEHISSNMSLRIQVTALDLSHNLISAIHSGDFKLYKDVSTLDLSHNRLLQVDGDVFWGLETLRELNLSHNAIVELENNTFHPLVNLKVLDLSFNNLRMLLLSELPVLSSLQYLYLNDNHLHVVPSATSVFPPLPNLIYLDLSSNPLTDIPPDMFQDLPSLNILYMANASIQTVSEYSFRSLNNLQELSLDRNNIVALSDPVFQNTSLVSLSLAYMPLLVNISHDAFLDLPQLNCLNLSHNPQLSFLQPNLLTLLDELRVLDLSDSGLEQLSVITFRNNKKLSKVFLRNNPLLCSCTNAWLAIQDAVNDTKFVDLASLQCVSEQGSLSTFSNASFQCEEIRIHNMTTKVSATLGSQLMLRCQYETDEPGVITWTTPRGTIFYHHHFHPDASQHLLSPHDIQPDSQFHASHYWHNSTSYHSELSSYKDRVLLLSDGSLYIDYMLRSDTGPYQCMVSNAMNNHSATIVLLINSNISGDVKIFGFIVGLLCALGFFTLNVIYVIISWTARRLVNKRRREIIRQMLENLNAYKSTQITRIHENYTYQLGRVRNQYHIQCARLHRNYTVQVTKMKRGCSNQVERVRDNYNSKLNHLREYSSNQIMQIRERANNQIIRIRDYGSTQLERLRETYKLQQQHVLKLLDTMNLENCRNVVETECMRTESMMFDIDLLGDVDRTDSPLSPGESEYNTAASSPATSMEDDATAGFRQDMARHHGGDSSDDNSIVIEMQTTIDLEGGVSVDVAEMWKYGDDNHDQQGDEDNHGYLMNVRCQTKNGNESLLQLQSDRSLLARRDFRRCVKAGMPLPTLDLDNQYGETFLDEADCRKRSDSDDNWDVSYMTPEASPTKLWHGESWQARFRQKERGDLFGEDDDIDDDEQNCDLYFPDDSDSSETKM